MVGEVQLEGRDPGQRPGRGADLGGEVGQGGQVVAEHGGLGGEPVAGQLHAVAGVAGEPDDDAIELDDLFGHDRDAYVVGPIAEHLRPMGAMSPIGARLGMGPWP